MSRHHIEYVFSATDRVSDDVRDIERQIGSLERHARGFGGVMRDAFGFDFGAADILQTAGDTIITLNQLGSEANRIEASFAQLSQEVGGAETTLSAMRIATGGVIDDIQLMTAANSLLLTGIAKSSDDLAAMTSGAVKLGAAMGQDAAASIENFNAAMLNMSYERLDTLGVSASAVRERVAELNAAGMETGEAFQVATLEQMEVSLGRLGDAADSSATSLDRMSTRVRNLTTDIGQLVNQGLEAGSMLIEIPVIYVEHHMATRGLEQEARDTAQAVAQEYTDAFTDWYGTSDVDGMVYNVIKTQVRNQLLGVEQTTEEILAEYGVTMNRMSDDYVERMMSAQNFAMLYNPDFDAIVGTGATTADLERRSGRAQEEARLNRESRRIVEERAAAEERSRDAAADAANYYVRNLESSAAMAIEMEAISTWSDISASAWQQINAIAADSVRDFGGIPIATQEAADEAARLALEAENALTAAEHLGIEGEQLTFFQRAADDARQIADEVQRAADNLATMNAREMFGGRDDPTMNFLDDVLGSAGVSDEARMLATGEITEVELRFNADVAPVLEAINTVMGEEAAVQASTRFVEEYTRSLESGLSESEALRNAQEAIGFALSPTGALAYTGEGFDVEGAGGALGEMAGGLFADVGSLDMLREQVELTHELHESQMMISEVVMPDFSGMNVGLLTANSVSEELRVNLEDMATKTYTTKVIIETEVRGALPGGPATITQARIADSEV